MSDTPISAPSARRRFVGSNPRLLVMAAALVALGGGAGAIAMHSGRPTVTMAPVIPVAIHSLAPGSIATVKGRVAEIYGNKFIMADPSGRALVDTGHRGERALVTLGEDVTVQGRFDRGFMHAAFLVGPDAKITALEPLDGPHGGRHGHHERRPGPDDDRDDGPRAPLPPQAADSGGPAMPAASTSATGI